MRLRAAGWCAALLLGAGPALAQDVVQPPASLALESVPPIPAELARKVRPYTEFRPHALLSWHPAAREMLVRRRLDATNQVHRVPSPLAVPQPLTDFADAVPNASYQPTHGRYFVLTRAAGGDEVYRLFRHDIASREETPLSPAGERAQMGAWSRAGDRIVFTTSRIDRNNPDRIARTSIHVMDPAKPDSGRVLERIEGGSWGSFRFSEDGARLVFLENVSSSESHAWVMEVATGRRTRITPLVEGRKVRYGDPYFSADGRAIYATSDRAGEFRQLVRLPLGAGRERVLTGHLPYDVDNLEVSYDAGLIAFITNESGAHVLRFIELKTLEELPRPPLVHGVMGGLEWRRGSSEIGFHITSARSSGDVFSYDVKENRLTRWTNGNNPEVNVSELAEPRVVKWKSFDGREISGLYYHPPARFAGKRPVFIVVHGGPASQARPGFIGRYNYLLNELGIALIYPNVRGSTGFGKTFATLDDGTKREDSVKDVGALIEWIRARPDLDGSRVLVGGGSYGGYMALACAVHYADRIAGAISVVGISSFVTFLERTETYRRDLRRAEYGDERDAAMRAHLESISPLNRVDRIAKPLLVAHGRNDPRVPFGEAEQIVAALKKRGTPAWFIAAADEGHGFVKKPNADYLFYATAEFARRTLLP
jgi:dipeptidyl aminopeptidase/acylaminoacyl peptidase